MKFLEKIKSLWGVAKETSEPEVVEPEIPHDPENEEITTVEVKDNGMIKMDCPYCRNKRARASKSGKIKCSRCKSVLGRRNV